MRTLIVLSALAAGAVGCAGIPPSPTAAPPALLNISTPEPGVFSSGRFAAADVPKLAASGVRHVIDLMREAETPDFDERAALARAGIRYDSLPVAGADDLTLARVQAFDRLVAGADRPLLVHCSSANRVGAMAALRAGWLQGADVEAALAVGRAWGLKALEPAVRERLARGVPSSASGRSRPTPRR